MAIKHLLKLDRGQPELRLVMMQMVTHEAGDPLPSLLHLLPLAKPPPPPLQPNVHTNPECSRVSIVPGMIHVA